VRDAVTRLLEHFEPLRVQFGKKKCRTRDIGFGFRKVRDESGRHSVAADGHHDRNFSGHLLCRPRAGCAVRDEKIDSRRNELTYQLREPVVPFLCPAKLDGNVPAFDIAEVTKACSECIYRACRPHRRCRAKEADTRARGSSQLLRTQRGRQRGCRTTEKCDEFTSFHRITRRQMDAGWPTTNRITRTLIAGEPLRCVTSRRIVGLT
jgi:hypothetical protein